MKQFSNILRIHTTILLFSGWLFSPLFANAQTSTAARPVSPIIIQPKGTLVYLKDSLGNRVPDFSFAGYNAGSTNIPDVRIAVSVAPVAGDATGMIQSAIDFVSSLPPDRNGFRGAVLLQKGIYRVNGGLTIKVSGVVVRGSGMHPEETTIVAAGMDRQTLFTISGRNDLIASDTIAISDHYVPVNAIHVRLAKNNFKVGDPVLIRRPSTAAWIKKLGTEHFGGGLTTLGWKPGKRDLYWDRQVVAVNGNMLTLDAPITTALDSSYGGGYAIKYTWPGRIRNCAVENIRLVSEFDSTNAKDEQHRWMAITFQNITDAWVRQVSFEHFAGSAVAVLESAKRITVEDCKSMLPVSEIGGQRRYTFHTSGQQTLFQRCYAQYGYHDFSAGYASSLNAFVQCKSSLPHSFSGAIDSWASGILFDVVEVDGGSISYLNRGQDAQGAGWTAANSMIWQCSASRIDNYKPPTANNWAIGCWAEFSGDGYWESSNEHVKPRSLYYAQLAERLGDSVLNRAFLMPVVSEASSSPSTEVAAHLTNDSRNPPPGLELWIDKAPERQKISAIFSGQPFTALKSSREAPEVSTVLKNGWLTRNDEVIAGHRVDQPWWRGNTRPDGVKESGPAISRFVPGRSGPGLTDDLDEMTDQLVRSNRKVFEHNYGLWYDRRRDDHERIRRGNGEVWPPFYELPFARSGTGNAWDGLSKYDLTKYNFWYWKRLQQFADFADQKGLILLHQNYFQHNILEAGAHYTDFPWRTANNVNNTGFPEPVPYAGDKRIFMDQQFYDITNPVRRTLHHAYIRKCLDNFKNNTAVIQFTSAEYTGPLHFMQFWIDVISEWEKENASHQLVALSATKDVQDSILADPVRSAVVDAIDIRYWHYQQDGSLYAPEGDKHLAPRQHARLLKPRAASPEQVYRSVREYRERFPKKAIIYSAQNYDNAAWAVFMAGGSLPALPANLSSGFFKAAATMTPAEVDKSRWVLSNQHGDFIVYTSEKTIPVNLSPGQKFLLHWIDPKTGNTISTQQKTGNKTKTQLSSPKSGTIVLWVMRA